MRAPPGNARLRIEGGTRSDLSNRAKTRQAPSSYKADGGAELPARARHHMGLPRRTDRSTPRSLALSATSTTPSAIHPEYRTRRRNRRRRRDRRSSPFRTTTRATARCRCVPPDVISLRQLVASNRRALDRSSAGIAERPTCSRRSRPTRRRSMERRWPKEPPPRSHHQSAAKLAFDRAVPAAPKQRRPRPAAPSPRAQMN